LHNQNVNLALNCNTYYRSILHIHPLSRISLPYIFSRSSCTGIFILQIGPPPTMANSNMIFRWNSYTMSSSRSQWWSGNTRTKPASTDQLRNSQTIDRKRVCEWHQRYSTLKGQTRRVLGKHRRLRCGQPLSVDLDHPVCGGQEKRRQIIVEPASVTD